MRKSSAAPSRKRAPRKTSGSFKKSSASKTSASFKKSGSSSKGTGGTTRSSGTRTRNTPQNPLSRKRAGANAAAKSDTNRRQTKSNRLEPLSTTQRLQKILAAAGFGSRRSCEELITTGRVEVDREVVTQLGTQVDPSSSEIRVDGQVLRKTKPVYIALFKPKGYLCTHSDQKGRKRAIDLIPETFGRLFSVGRLDLASEGLIIFTNDGELAERLTHPRYGVPKVYRVQVAGTVEPKTIEKLEKGVYLAEGIARAEEVVVKGYHKQSTILEITLREGKNREIRRLLAHCEHKVMTLIRYSVGPIKIGKMLPGDYRVLTPREVTSLYEAVKK